jgi:hypothetical protein
MSRNEWESGTIVIPSDQYVAFRKALIAEHNRIQEGYLARAAVVLEAVRTANKHARNVNWAVAIENYYDTLPQSRNDDGDGHYEEMWAVQKLILEYPQVAVGWDFKDGQRVPVKFGDDRSQLPKLRSPKKKNLNLLPISKGARLDAGEASISLDDEKRTVHYSSGENNHACDYARKQPLVRKMFSLLRGITWKRGSGGEIVGNDEYNQDSRDSGGGSNYTKDRFGPDVKQPSRQNVYGGGFGYGFMGGPRY